MNVEQIMERNVLSCALGERLSDAARTMWRLGCSTLPVCDARGELRGQLDARSIYMHTCLEARPIRELRVADVEVGPAVSCSSTTKVACVQALLRTSDAHYVYVTDSAARLAGLLTRRRLARAGCAATGCIRVFASGHEDIAYEPFDGWTLMVARHQLVSPRGTTVPIRRNLLRALLAFIDYPGVVLTRSALTRLVCNRDWDACDRYIDVLVGQLRRRFCDDGRSQQVIRTVHGRGYLFLPRVEYAGDRAADECAWPSPFDACRLQETLTPEFNRT